MNKGERGYFIRLFNGNISLPMTYWVWGILISSLGAKLLLYWYNVNILTMNNIFGESLNILVPWFFIIFSLFVLIAIWRSADKYEGVEIWSILAKGMVIFSTLNIFYTQLQPYFLDKDMWIQESLSLANETVLPVLIDEGTRVDKIIYKDKELTYHYTILADNLKNINSIGINKVLNNIKTNTLPSVCIVEDKIVRYVLDNSQNLRYFYRDVEGNTLGSFSINKEECNTLVNNIKNN